MVPCLKSTFPQAKRRRLRLPLASNTLPMLDPWRWFLALVIVWNAFWLIPLSGRLLCEGEDRDSEDSSADTGGLQTQVRPSCSKSNQSAISSLFQEWNVHKDWTADDHQDNQDDDPAVPTSGLGRGSSICTITITIPVFVITYPNLTKMKRHVWYWCSRAPVSFPNQVFEKSTPLTTLCDTDRSALIKSNSVSDVE